MLCNYLLLLTVPMSLRLAFAASTFCEHKNSILQCRVLLYCRAL